MIDIIKRTDLDAALAGLKASIVRLIGSGIAGAELTANKGVANGYASLDGTGKVPLAQLPSGIGGGNDQLSWMKI